MTAGAPRGRIGAMPGPQTAFQPCADTRESKSKTAVRHDWHLLHPLTRELHLLQPEFLIGFNLVSVPHVMRKRVCAYSCFGCT